MQSLVNRVTLIGRAGHQPEVRQGHDGHRYAYLKLYQNAAPEPGGRQVHHLSARNALADQLYRLVRRGDRVLVQGKLVYRTEARAGAAGSRTEIHLSGFDILRKNKERVAADAASTTPANSVGE